MLERWKNSESEGRKTKEDCTQLEQIMSTPLEIFVSNGVKRRKKLSLS